MYLLDTNVVSELRVTARANANVVRWTRNQPPERFFLSVATVLELQYGALLLERRDRLSGKVFTDWINNRVLPDFGGRILPITIDIALTCAKLHVPDRRGDRDAWIAATALVHGLTVVTRNTRDFSGTGASVFNPWEATR
jgi:predicted nucleic acid-binding protein